MEKESNISLGGILMYVREMKEQSVRVTQFLLALKNVAQKECAPRY